MSETVRKVADGYGRREGKKLTPAPIELRRALVTVYTVIAYYGDHARLSRLNLGVAHPPPPELS